MYPFASHRSLMFLSSLSLGLLCAGVTAARAAGGSQDSRLEQACQKAGALAEKSEAADYRGWLKYLSHEARATEQGLGASSAEAVTALKRLENWTSRIEADPGTLGKLRGVQEWAYESQADASGQPFKLSIPTDYDPSRPVPLLIYMHGYSGNHLEHSAGMSERTGAFEVAVLGRARGGWYRGLSEADVLDVVSYIRAHWNIDPANIHLSGGSMGGGACFRLGARYPHLWASARPTCGYAPNLHAGNLLNLPIYATHSDDDWVVPIVQSRAMLTRLRELGGLAVADETSGLGHAAWNFKEGNQRSEAWRELQTRPASRQVRRIDHVVTDGAAPRAWWAELAEWGPENRPARFRLVSGAANFLQADLNNVSRLLLRLDEAPLDPTKALSLSVNGGVPLQLPAPLPARIEVQQGDKGWRLAAPSGPSLPRLHTPGGASLLYQGEPLLIVYGTGGDAAEREAMLRAAKAASRSPNPSWATSDGEKGSDGIPHFDMTYASLNTKADTEVKEEDLARCHLVLIGTAKQNALVARLADKLPVRLSSGKITCSDGLEIPAAGRSLGLVHFNPLAPARLLFWVASEEASAYRPGAYVPAIADLRGLGCDLLIMANEEPTLIAARAFDSHWNWIPGRDKSPLLQAGEASHEQVAFLLDQALLRHQGGDFALASVPAAPEKLAVCPGFTRLSDLSTLYYNQVLAEMRLSGAELLKAARKLETFPGDGLRYRCRFQPAIDPAHIDPARDYRIILPSETLAGFATGTRQAPTRVKHLDATLSEALDAFQR